MDTQPANASEAAAPKPETTVPGVAAPVDGSDPTRKHYWQSDCDAEDPGPLAARRVVRANAPLNPKKPYVRLEWASPTDPDDLSYGGYAGSWQMVSDPADATHWGPKLKWLERHFVRAAAHLPETQYEMEQVLAVTAA